MLTLNEENFQKGLLVTAKHIAGVVALEERLFAAFTTDIETGETQSFETFESLDTALSRANELGCEGTFENFGCAKGPHCHGAQHGACPTCSNNSH